MSVFKIIRILILLTLFIVVAFYAKSQKLSTRSWLEPLEVVIFPINSEDNADIEFYISQLSDQDFADIEQFFTQQGKLYPILTEQPINVRLGPSLRQGPPPSPNSGSNTIKIIWWSIRFRVWAVLNTPDQESNYRRVRVFLNYHESMEGRKLQHSLGLDKGLLAIVQGFADKKQTRQNNIIIAHELLHTVGALDKYDQNSEPIFPQSYADPEQRPLFPQQLAEIMSARIPLSPNSSRMAMSLKECFIGKQTAQEINW